MTLRPHSRRTSSRVTIAVAAAGLALACAPTVQADSVKALTTTKANSCTVSFSSALTGPADDVFPEPPWDALRLLKGETDATCTRNMRLVTSVHATRFSDGAVVGTDSDACHEDTHPQGCMHMNSAFGPTAVDPGDYKVDFYWAGQIYNLVPPNNPAYERWNPPAQGSGCWLTTKGGEVMQCSHVDLRGF